MEEVTLPVEKVDIIISEWMGYFLLYESMLDCVLWARDKYLVPGGIILPDKCSMHIAAIEDAEYKHEKLTFWDNVYGFNMSCITPATVVEPLVDTINSNAIVSTVSKFFEFDINTVTKEELEYSATYSVTLTKKDNVHGVVTWFDIEFGNLPNIVRFSTSPRSPYTHWKTVVFYIDGAHEGRQGDKIEGSIAVRKSKSNFRELDIKMSFHFHSYERELSSQVKQFKLR